LLLQEIFLHQPLFLLHNTRNQPHLISNLVQKETKKPFTGNKKQIQAGFPTTYRAKNAPKPCFCRLFCPLLRRSALRRQASL
jgi:hypothetical protein